MARHVDMSLDALPKVDVGVPLPADDECQDGQCALSALQLMPGLLSVSRPTSFHKASNLAELSSQCGRIDVHQGMGWYGRELGGPSRGTVLHLQSLVSLVVRVSNGVSWAFRPYDAYMFWGRQIQVPILSIQHSKGSSPNPARIGWTSVCWTERSLSDVERVTTTCLRR